MTDISVDITRWPRQRKQRPHRIHALRFRGFDKPPEKIALSVLLREIASKISRQKYKLDHNIVIEIETP